MWGGGGGDGELTLSVLKMVGRGGEIVGGGVGRLWGRGGGGLGTRSFVCCCSSSSSSSSSSFLLSLSFFSLFPPFPLYPTFVCAVFVCF